MIDQDLADLRDLIASGCDPETAAAVLQAKHILDARSRKPLTSIGADGAINVTTARVNVAPKPNGQNGHQQLVLQTPPPPPVDAQADPKNLSVTAYVASVIDKEDVLTAPVGTRWAVPLNIVSRLRLCAKTSGKPRTPQQAANAVHHALDRYGVRVSTVVRGGSVLVVKL